MRERRFINSPIRAEKQLEEVFVGTWPAMSAAKRGELPDGLRAEATRRTWQATYLHLLPKTFLPLVRKLFALTY